MQACSGLHSFLLGCVFTLSEEEKYAVLNFVITEEFDQSRTLCGGLCVGSRFCAKQTAYHPLISKLLD